MLPAYDPIQHIPPPIDLLPTLRLVYLGREYAGQYRAYLCSALCERLQLRAYQPIDLVPPSGHSPYWHLDLRPEAKRRLAQYADTRPRISSLKLPVGLVEPGSALVLQLVNQPAFPGFYPMLPHALAA
ncbi:hypothetical protein FNT36_03165 [Hymenobacter setariae]|uniref:Uncharacterized protein n=1 Tax=Hymenobacter setariae TaxID=2594794 RepID=A0A558C310_9BACT|nr:hypothetical protein [Hymenobacter setariae]TVT43106.1 hypothetical protein FNT36_03165 [Hymenobacter setariae]